MRIAILTISTAGVQAQRDDTSGAAAVLWADARGDKVVATAMVADDTVDIVRQLITWCDNDEADLVLTTGGTGLSPTDVTPEATRAVIERETPGIAERLRTITGQNFPRAALSRGIAGIRNKTLIVNLPGATNGVRECLAALEPIVQHAVDIVRDAPTDHTKKKA